MATEAEMRSHRCCFTGHRPEKIGIPEEMVIDLLDKAISEAIRAGYSTFISGMARGVDIWAAEIVLVERLEALKQKLSEYTDFENTLIIPDGVIEAFTEQIIASDKGFDWYLKAVPDMVKSFMDDTPDDETEKEWHELTQFDLTIEDAKAYVYSFSSRRRVHGWQNIKIRLFV